MRKERKRRTRIKEERGETRKMEDGHKRGKRERRRTRIERIRRN